MRPIERDDMQSSQQRAYLPQNPDDRLKEFLAPSLYSRLVAETQRRNVGISQVLRSLSISRPK